MSSTPGKSRGRPRAFDRAAALEAATLLFWRHGYEGTSIAQLAEAMGIAPPSLYAAFGSKEELYREALVYYVAGPGDIGASALEDAENLREAVAQILATAAAAYTRPDMPRGCMVASGSISCGRDNQIAVEATASIRAGLREGVSACLRRACVEGELPPDTDVEALEAFLGAVIEGMSIQARDGAPRERLLKIAEQAMRAWPGDKG